MPWIDVPQAPGAQRAARAQAQTGAPTADAGPRWYSIRNAADADEAEVLLYDVIGGWFGIYADEFLAELRDISSPRMRVRINSPGGDVFEGIAIANALRAHPATVTVQVDGIAASIASVIAMAGDRVEMAPNSMIMIHEASGMCYGDTAEMTKMAEVLDLISTNIANAYAARSGTDAAGWRNAMKVETWYLPDGAVEAGLADVALSAVPQSPNVPDEPEEDDAAEEAEELIEARMHARWDLAAYGYQGPKQPEKPKPSPPPAARTEPEQPPALVISISDLLDEKTVAALRAAVQAPADVSAEPVGTGQGETVAAGPAAPSVAVEPAGDDGWDAVIARITTPEPDPWAAAFAHLTQTPASSATDA